LKVVKSAFVGEVEQCIVACSVYFLLAGIIIYLPKLLFYHYSSVVWVCDYYASAPPP